MKGLFRKVLRLLPANVLTELGRLRDAWTIRTSGLFDAAWYRHRHPEAGHWPLLHYVRHGAAAGHAPCPFFDPHYYWETNPDVRVSGLDPFAHYLTIGGREGRNPSPLFDGRGYLAAYPEVAASGVSPLAHYLTRGLRDGCSIPLPPLRLRR